MYISHLHNPYLRVSLTETPVSLPNSRRCAKVARVAHGRVSSSCEVPSDPFARLLDGSPPRVSPSRQTLPLPGSR